MGCSESFSSLMAPVHTSEDFCNNNKASVAPTEPLFSSTFEYTEKEIQNYVVDSQISRIVTRKYDQRVNPMLFLVWPVDQFLQTNTLEKDFGLKGNQYNAVLTTQTANAWASDCLRQRAVSIVCAMTLTTIGYYPDSPARDGHWSQVFRMLPNHGGDVSLLEEEEEEVYYTDTYYINDPSENGRAFCAGFFNFAGNAGGLISASDRHWRCACTWRATTGAGISRKGLTGRRRTFRRLTSQLGRRALHFNTSSDWAVAVISSSLSKFGGDETVVLPHRPASSSRLGAVMTQSMSI
ncbi:hypothetical protein B0H17DRAFT_1134047 [Mycena rosella]|uniref:Uncharacterized protein n=1 Tax=Mycena rosella TaxID=1033263 RepID=A0AAD7DHL6_MYCRO|nr:hypothetical protein B0H17DRAFT_1134047 [Mycena rosella]